MLKINEIREFDAQEIQQRIADNESELTDLRFKRAVTGLEDPMVLRNIRRENARLKTVLAEKARTETRDAA